MLPPLTGKASRPSKGYVHYDAPKSTLLPWKDVAEQYTAITGEPMSDVRAEDFAIRALRKLYNELAKDENKAVRDAIRAHLS